MKELVNSDEMSRILDRLAFQITEDCSDLSKLLIVGIHRRGVPLSLRIRDRIKKHQHINVPVGTIDITLYRDDLSEIGLFPEVYSSELNFDISGKTVLLVDDVIYTGRTVRAALEALIDYGRPSKIAMVALVDRGHRELPIQPDFVGKVIPTSKKEIIDVMLIEVDGKDSVSIREKANGVK